MKVSCKGAFSLKTSQNITTDLRWWFQRKVLLFAQVTTNTEWFLQKEIANRLMQLHLKLHYGFGNNQSVLSLLPRGLLHIMLCWAAIEVDKQFYCISSIKCFECISVCSKFSSFLLYFIEAINHCAIVCCQLVRHVGHYNRLHLP